MNLFDRFVLKNPKTGKYFTMYGEVSDLDKAETFGYYEWISSLETIYNKVRFNDEKIAIRKLKLKKLNNE